VFSHTHALLANMAGLDPAMAVLQLQLCPGRQDARLSEQGRIPQLSPIFAARRKACGG